MTHANHPHFDLAILQRNAQSQMLAPPPLPVTCGGSTAEHPSLFGSLPRYLTSSSTQPPAWWLDKRAKLDDCGALAC